MRKLLIIILGLTLTACAEYQGAKTNCWTNAPSAKSKTLRMSTRGGSLFSHSASKAPDTEECVFEPLD